MVLSKGGPGRKGGLRVLGEGGGGIAQGIMSAKVHFLSNLAADWARAIRDDATETVVPTQARLLTEAFGRLPAGLRGARLRSSPGSL